MKQEMIPQLLLEKYILRELNETDNREVERAIRENTEVARRIEELKKSNEEIIAAYSPEYFMNLLENRLNIERKEPKRSPKKYFPVFKLATFASAAFCAIFIVILNLPPLFETENVNNFMGNEVVRIKGETTFKIYQKHFDDFENMKEGSQVENYDNLQLSYLAGTDNYGIIFSIDGRGIVTLHYPYSENTVPKLDKKGEIFLQYSYQLDDAPEFERFFFITSEKTFEVSRIIKKTENLIAGGILGKKGSLNLSEDFSESSILLLKEK